MKVVMMNGEQILMIDFFLYRSDNSGTSASTSSSASFSSSSASSSTSSFNDKISEI